MPVGLTVPNLQGAGAESKLYRSLTTQAIPPTSKSPVPQGLCVVTPDGTVLEWIQVFEDEEAFLEFLSRNLARCRARPRAAPPAAHAAGETCPNTPLPQRGSLTGTVYGRALDDDGQQVAISAHSRESE